MSNQKATQSDRSGMEHQCHKFLIPILFTVVFGGCADKPKESVTSPDKTCRGEWAEKDQNGLVRQRYIETMGNNGCTTDPVPLSQWEKSLITRFEHKVTCTPQPDLPNMWVRSANNYYTYRNDKIFIELDAAKGEARRLIIGQMPDGQMSFNRQVFCYYARTDVENEPTNPHDYGSMLQFDLELSASSNSFTPMEIYNYDLVGNELRLQKMDNNYGVDWTWCPSDSTPWGFCDFLRNGNEFYYPEDPSPAVKAELYAAAVLIRSELNTIQISKTDFDAAWENSAASGIEVGTWAHVETGGKWKHMVNAIFDEPLFVGRAWRQYMRRERPSMPDVAWASSNGFPNVCYTAKKEVLLNDGSRSFVEGEVCYLNGEYVFTQ